MGERLSRAVEWLFIAPWRLVLLVALVALPLLLTSELSSREQREQLRASEERAAVSAAQRAAATLGGRLLAIRDGISGTIIAESLNHAVSNRDSYETGRLLAIARGSMGDEVLRIYALDRDTTVVGAADPSYLQVIPESGVIGKPFAHPERLPAMPAYEFTSNVLFSEPYRQPDTGRVLISISQSYRRDITRMYLVAEIDLDRMTERLAGQLDAGDDLYVADGTGALIVPLTARTRAEGPAFGTSILPLGPRDGPFAARTPDPIGGRAALAAVALVPQTEWRVMLVRSAVSPFDPVLDQVSLIRLLLVAVLLLGAFAVAASGSEALRQRRAVERVSQEKSRFLASMSHELRTPLNAIIGFSQLLDERMAGELNPKQSEYVRDVTESGKHLLSLINDVLDLSKVEAGKMDFHPERFPLAGAVRRTHALVAPLADEKGVRLVVDADEGLPTVWHDPGRFRQVLYNLLSNAVKFTPEGGSVTTAVRSDGDSWFELCVSDTGIGMSAEDRATIFEEFKRLESSYARAQQGTGLGLALVKRFVTLMGGEVSVTSELGKGSTFTVRLPSAMPIPAAV